MSRPDNKKITQALNYIANKEEGGRINYMKAIKLLYLADRLHLRKYGRLISEDRLVAMKKGMVGSRTKDIAVQSDSLPHAVYEYTKDKLKRNLEQYLIEANDGNLSSLSVTDIQALDTVYDVFGDKTGFELGDLTHELPEYQRVEYPIKTRESKMKRVDVSDLFKDTDNTELQQIYNQSDDELNMSREIFLESSEQDRCLV